MSPIRVNTTETLKKFQNHTFSKLATPEFAIWPLPAKPRIRPDKVARFSSADHLTERTVYLYVAPLRPRMD
jgi:hypothetical protein